MYIYYILKTKEYLAEATTVAQETFNNVRTVRSFAQEKKEINRYSEAVNKTLEEGMKKALAYGSWGGGIGLLMYSAMLGVLYVSTNIVQNMIIFIILYIYIILIMYITVFYLVWWSYGC